MKQCPICTHINREEIESVLFKMAPDSAQATISEISKAYEIPITCIQEHTMFHASYIGGAESDSIVRQIKMREADILAEVALDQMHTVKIIGKRIRNYTKQDDINFEKMLTKPVVDLYIGASDGLRKNMQTLVDIDQVLNGPKDDGLSGLAALANALDASRRGGTPAAEDSE